MYCPRQKFKVEQEVIMQQQLGDALIGYKKDSSFMAWHKNIKNSRKSETTEKNYQKICLKPLAFKSINFLLFCPVTEHWAFFPA